jgi:hypothetical protein
MSETIVKGTSEFDELERSIRDLTAQVIWMKEFSYRWSCIRHHGEKLEEHYRANAGADDTALAYLAGIVRKAGEKVAAADRWLMDNEPKLNRMMQLLGDE